MYRPATRLLPTLPALLAPLALAAALCLLGACGSGKPATGSGRAITVVATTPHVADLVANVAGARAEVIRVMDPGSDPHHFEPRTSDVAATVEAVLLFSNGNGLDEWAERLIEDGGGDAELVDLADAADADSDPHWWHDPRKAIAAVGEIRSRLAAADPAGAEQYGSNADAYAQALRQLDREIATCMNRIPSDRRKLVTDHDAFGSFAERYGLEVIGTVIPSQTTQAQASAKDLSELAKTVRRERVPAIFPSHSVSPKLAESIAAQTGASADHPLYGDTLEGDPEGVDTYSEMLAANAEAIIQGLTSGRESCGLG